MKKILLTNEQNEQFDAGLVRYFKYGNDYYLIYSLGEKDEKNYMKLYLVEIMEELGELVSQNIKDEEKWNGMQLIVKEVLKEIKSNKRKKTVDLDADELENLKIVNPKFFKLDSKLVDILESDYFEQEEDGEDFDARLNDIAFEEIVPVDLPLDEIILPPDEIKSVDNINNDVEIPEYDDNMVMLQDEIEPTDDDVEIPEYNSNIEIAQNEIKTEEEVMNETNKEELVETNEIDYKELYFDLKQEQAITDELMNELLNDLNRYKEQYGELK